jgi:RNA polymerase sigma factor (sigma-70 family)
MGRMSDARADRELLRELYEKYASRVYDRCRYLLRNDEEARDAMHDVFIKVGKNLSQFRGEASPLTWMTRIATNHCLNVVRAKNAQWHERFKSEVATHEKTHEGGLSWKEDRQLLRLCLAGLDKDVAEAAVYYFVDEMTQAEITTLMGISAPTLRKRLRLFIERSRAVIVSHVPGAVFEEAPI